MNIFDYNKRRTELRKNKERLLKLDPRIPELSGIYVFIRANEEGFEFAYVGQAKKILTRCAQHMTEHQQHIDNSLHKLGLYGADNPYGWTVIWFTYPEEKLNDEEKKFIKHYADLGYQLLNVTSGSQGVGKNDINERKPSKGYYDGLSYGRYNLAKELQTTLKYLNIAPKDDKKLTMRMYNKFLDLVALKQEEGEEDGEN